MRDAQAWIVGGAAAAILLSLAVGGRAGEWLFALLAVSFPLLLVASRRPVAAPARIAIAVLALIVWTSAVAILVLSAPGTASRIVAGLPLSAWIAFVGLAVAPFVLATWAYVAAFGARARRDPREPGG